MTIVGVGWYKKDQWEDLRRISTDKDALEDTWEEWAQNAERTLAEMMKKGFMMQKVSVDVHELDLWCRAEKRACDGEARAVYITSKLRSK